MQQLLTLKRPFETRKIALTTPYHLGLVSCNLESMDARAQCSSDNGHSKLGSRLCRTAHLFVPEQLEQQLFFACHHCEHEVLSPIQGLLCHHHIFPHEALTDVLQCVSTDRCASTCKQIFYQFYKTVFLPLPSILCIR